MLHVLFIGLSGLVSTLLFALCPDLSFWWRLPIFLGLYVGFALLFVVWFFTMAAVLPSRTPSPKRYAVYHRFIYWLVSWATSLIGYRVRLEHIDQLPEQPFLLVCNHRSGFDPVLTLAAFPRPLAFVSKPENFRIPFVGVAMKKACFLAIDRENPRNAVTTIKQAAEQINAIQLPMAIYPEGTRNKESEALLPFHAGSFKIAKLANCPVVVATLRYEKRRPFGKTVTLRIVDVMNEAFVAENNTATLSDRAREKMEENLGL